MRKERRKTQAEGTKEGNDYTGRKIITEGRKEKRKVITEGRKKGRL